MTGAGSIVLYIPSEMFDKAKVLRVCEYIFISMLKTDLFIYYVFGGPDRRRKKSKIFAFVGSTEIDCVHQFF